MVVSLLALLFVVVTGFLSVARSNRAMVVDVGQSDLIDAVVDDMDDWAIALIKEQIVDASGKVLPGGSGDSYSFEDIAGYRHSNYLAALEPLWDPAPYVPVPLNSGSWSVLGELCWPAVTSLDDAVAQPQAFPLFRLILDYDFSDPAIRRDDVRWNARKPFMDADGDGVPDSSFLLCAPATEAANTMAGTSVQLPRYDPNNPTGANGAFVAYRIPQPLVGYYDGASDSRGHVWLRYDEHARYEVAMRIISHGGMVTLSSPTLYDTNNTAYVPFNREFTIDLFDAIKIDARRMRQQYHIPDEQNRLFDDLQAHVTGVESSLRRRFILPSPPDEVYRFDIYRRVPPILAELQGETDLHAGFPATFIPSFSYPSSLSDPGNWQRINIGVESRSGDERISWARAVARDPTVYNTSGSGGDEQGTMGGVPYDRRHFITTINNSDELARKQDPNDPRPTSTSTLELGVAGRGATYEGALKFYLREVTKAFTRTTGSQWEHEFDYSGKGRAIIEELARVYYDMLASHSGTGDDWGNLRDLEAGDKEVVSRRQQAFMLAVNTVAFAAPRDTGSGDPDYRGLIDLVSYRDLDPGGGGTGITYTGYSPQPFFTEVIAYDAPDSVQQEEEGGGGGGGGGEEEVKLAIAVELYNPQDPYYDGTTNQDYFALNLSQFGIRIDEDTGSTVQTLAGLLPPQKRFLNGREFLAIVIKDTSDATDHFDDRVDGSPLEVTLDSTSDNLNISLLRYSNDGLRAEVIDRIRVARPDNGEWKARTRDTSPAKYYGYGNWDVGTDPAGLDTEFARWNMVMGKTAVSNGSEISGAPRASLDVQRRQRMVLPGFPARVVDPDDPNTWGGRHVNFAPTIPLITMNAAPFNDLPMFGNPNDLRPRSFPTVGFMLFIPRYSHAKVLGGGVDADRYHVMSRTLKRQWEDKRHYTWTATNPIGFARALHPTEYPADFGHMPIFDNTQPVTSGTYLAGVSQDSAGSRVGMPWGLLVFDYFTTIDPTRDVNGDGKPDVDPLRVPGRININTAPWYVLANLPLLGPYDVNNPIDASLGQLPIRWEGSVAPSPASPSPAFWDPLAGVLTGEGYDPYDPANIPATRRLLATDVLYAGALDDGDNVPWQDVGTGLYRLGPWLAQSAAAYRDGVQYLQVQATTNFWVYADSQLRDGPGYMAGAGGVLQTDPMYLAYRYRPGVISGATTDLYGRIRGARLSAGAGQDRDRPDHFGFVSIGELANVKGFDSATHGDLSIQGLDWNGAVTTFADTPLWRGDFVKAVSMLALLDSQYLTTRSNTFTAYTSVMDRKDPQASLRSQVTVDRSNLLPRMTYAAFDNLGNLDPNWPMRPVLLDLWPPSGDGVPETPVRTTNEGAMPQIIAREHVGYFNARYDD